MMSSPHRIEQQLSAYLDGELPQNEMDEVRRHLEGSEPLRRALEELRQTKRMLGRLRAPELPREFVAELHARIDRPRPWWAAIQWLPRSALAVAAMLVVLLVATPLVLRQQSRLRASEASSDLFIRAAVYSASDDPYMDRAYLGLVSTDANLRLIGEDPRDEPR
jgi:anti-sigma factor RsiW